jgi:uncharacterized membrane protein
VSAPDDELISVLFISLTDDYYLHSIHQMLLFTVTQGSVLACIAAIGRWSEAPAEDQMSWSNIGVVTGIVLVVIVLAVL